MALTFGATTADRVELAGASGATAIGAYDPISIVMWVNLTTLTSTRSFINQGQPTNTDPNAIGFGATINATTSRLQWQRGRATTKTNYITASGVLVTGSWLFLAITWSSAASPTTHIYKGTLTTVAAEVTYTTTTDGSGANSNNTQVLRIGNGQGAGQAIQGSMAWVQIYNSVLSLNDLIGLQFNPRVLNNTAGGYWQLGYNGLNAQVDYSGNGRLPTIAGSPTVSGHVPLRSPFAHIGGMRSNSKYPAITRKHPVVMGGVAVG